jgi:hypothetical protein
VSSLYSCASSSGTTEPRNVDAAVARKQPEPRTTDVSTEQPGAVQEALPMKLAPGVDALPEGPCRKSVSCEEVKILVNASFVYEGREVCFADHAAQCACGRQLGVYQGDECYQY